MSLIHISYSRPVWKDPYLIVAVLFFFKGLIAIFTGIALTRVGYTVHRTKDPKEFWQLTAIDFLAGGGFIAYFLYKVYALAH